MHITGLDAHAHQLATEAVVVGVYPEARFTPAAEEIDEATGGLLKRLFETEELTGKPNEVVVLHGPAGVTSRKVVVVGLGPAEKLSRRIAFEASATAAKVLSEKRHAQVAFFLGADWTPDQNEAGIAGAMVGCTGSDLYRSAKKRYPFGDLLWSGGSTHEMESGAILGESINLTRRLVNEPPDRMYPETFAEMAQKVASECDLTIDIWDQAKLEAEGCGSMLAVAKGSSRPPRLVILRHQGGSASDRPLALVGKGVTFDSGGLSLKPSESMKTMKCDMAGAATVLGAMHAISKLHLPVNVIGMMGLVENMPGASAMKLGDVLTARNGKTIEVLNTDAEGRLVLADVLATAVEMKASRIIDLATLTGACVVALGNDIAGLMTNDEAWQQAVQGAADLCGEAAWPLPMHPEFSDQIKSNIADIKNIGEGRWGGAITAAKFLEEFVAETPWTHIDIAGPAYLDSGKSWCDIGGSGMYVRTLVEVVRGLMQ